MVLCLLISDYAALLSSSDFRVIDSGYLHLQSIYSKKSEFACFELKIGVSYMQITCKTQRQKRLAWAKSALAVMA